MRGDGGVNGRAALRQVKQDVEGDGGGVEGKEEEEGAHQKSALPPGHLVAPLAVFAVDELLRPTV